MSEPLLEAALALTGRDLPVVPLHGIRRLVTGQISCACGRIRCQSPAKHPLARLASRGLLDATTDLETIRRWWSAVRDANIGVRTGSVVVLDVDPGHGGDASLERLEQAHGALPATWRTLTGGGGEHIWFAAPATEIRNSAGRLGPGLDIRGAGGYVVAPPSRHISGRSYAWSVDHHPDEVLLSPLPDWLAALLREPQPQPANRIVSGWRELARDGVENGRRNNAVARLTGHLLRRYVDPELAHQLVQAWNEARCRPPLSREEVTRTVNSIAGKELRRREARLGLR